MATMKETEFEDLVTLATELCRAVIWTSLGRSAEHKKSYPAVMANVGAEIAMNGVRLAAAAAGEAAARDLYRILDGGMDESLEEMLRVGLEQGADVRGERDVRDNGGDEGVQGSAGN